MVPPSLIGDDTFVITIYPLFPASYNRTYVYVYVITVFYNNPFFIELLRSYKVRLHAAESHWSELPVPDECSVSGRRRAAGGLTL